MFLLYNIVNSILFISVYCLSKLELGGVLAWDRGLGRMVLDSPAPLPRG